MHLPCLQLSTVSYGQVCTRVTTALEYTKLRGFFDGWDVFKPSLANCLRLLPAREACAAWEYPAR